MLSLACAFTRSKGRQAWVVMGVGAMHRRVSAVISIRSLARDGIPGRRGLAVRSHFVGGNDRRFRQPHLARILYP